MALPDRVWHVCWRHLWVVMLMRLYGRAFDLIRRQSLTAQPLVISQSLFCLLQCYSEPSVWECFVGVLTETRLPTTLGIDWLWFLLVVSVRLDRPCYKFPYILHCLEYYFKNLFGVPKNVFVYF